MTYRIVEGVKMSDGRETFVGPCPLTFGTPEQIASWLVAHAIEVVPTEKKSTEAPEALTRTSRSGASRGRS